MRLSVGSGRTSTADVFAYLVIAQLHFPDAPDTHRNHSEPVVCGKQAQVNLRLLILFFNSDCILSWVTSPAVAVFGEMIEVLPGARTLLVTSASLLVTSALLVVTRTLRTGLLASLRTERSDATNGATSALSDAPGRSDRDRRRVSRSSRWPALRPHDLQKTRRKNNKKQEIFKLGFNVLLFWQLVWMFV